MSEITTYTHLINYCIDNNCTISVWNGNGSPIEKSIDFNEINQSIKSVVETTLAIFYKGGQEAGFAIINHTNSPTNTVVNCTESKFLLRWKSSYDKDIAGLFSEETTND